MLVRLSKVLVWKGGRGFEVKLTNGDPMREKIIGAVRAPADAKDAIGLALGLAKDNNCPLWLGPEAVRALADLLFPV